MSTKELFFLTALAASVFFMVSSCRTILLYQRKIGLEKSQKKFLYAITFAVPLLGYIFTRRLQRNLS